MTTLFQLVALLSYHQGVARYICIDVLSNPQQLLVNYRFV